MLPWPQRCDFRDEIALVRAPVVPASRLVGFVCPTADELAKCFDLIEEQLDDVEALDVVRVDRQFMSNSGGASNWSVREIWYQILQQLESGERDDEDGRAEVAEPGRSGRPPSNFRDVVENYQAELRVLISGMERLPGDQVTVLLRRLAEAVAGMDRVRVVVGVSKGRGGSVVSNPTESIKTLKAHGWSVRDIGMVSREEVRDHILAHSGLEAFFRQDAQSMNMLDLLLESWFRGKEKGPVKDMHANLWTLLRGFEEEVDV